jgi:hypothetical protein
MPSSSVYEYDDLKLTSLSRGSGRRSSTSLRHCKFQLASSRRVRCSRNAIDGIKSRLREEAANPAGRLLQELMHCRPQRVGAGWESRPKTEAEGQRSSA